MNINKYLLPGSIFSIFLFVFACADNQSIQKKLSEINQDPMHYAKTHSIHFSKEQQEQYKQDFLNHYFSVWDGSSTAEVKKDVLQDFKNFEKNPSWTQGNQPLPKQFFEHLQELADFKTYPNVNKPGIIVHGSYVRALPTLMPSFGDSKQAGEGYPFDNLEQSFIEKGTPVHVLQQSKDYLWYLINTASYSGWVPSQNVGFVAADFMSKWKQGPFVVTLRDHLPLVSDNQFVTAPTRIGILYPMVGETAKQFQVLIPILDGQGNAQLQTMSLSKENSRLFPIPISAQNLAAVARTMIGSPYGWGGLYQQRDCSATTSDLFASVGIWLPRNSLQQSKKGEVISLEGMTSKQKLETIKTRGIPFLTLLYAPGHITLYIATIGQEVYVLQDVWGLHTVNLLDQAGRAVIGKTVITPIDFGKNFLNVKETLLERVTSMSILKAK